MFFIFNTPELLTEHKRQESLNLGATYQKEPFNTCSVMTRTNPQRNTRLALFGKRELIKSGFGLDLIEGNGMA